MPTLTDSPPRPRDHAWMEGHAASIAEVILGAIPRDQLAEYLVLLIERIYPTPEEPS